MSVHEAEKKGLRLSVYGSFGLCSSGIVMAIYGQSLAILLDSLYTFLTLVMAFVSLKVVDFVEKPESKTRPFGYMALEPFLNLLKSLILLVVLVMFLVTSIQELLSGGRMIALDAMIIYIAICLGIYAAIIFKLKRYGRQAKSSILDLEIRNWLIDAALTVGIMGSLLLAVIAISMGYDQILPYIDPAFVLVLIALSLPLPLKTTWTEARRLLLISDDNNIEVEVNGVLAEVFLQHGIRRPHIWGLKSGRFTYLFIYADLDDQSRTMLELDEIRTEIFLKLDNLYSDFWADIQFTKIDPEVSSRSAPACRFEGGSGAVLGSDQHSRHTGNH
jgi:predicted Co/Zn/Cd cation transporter (cation efflux family)